MYPLRYRHRRRLELRERRRVAGTGVLLAAVLCLLAVGPLAGSTGDPAERPPAVAGRFYPLDAPGLRGAVEAYLADALTPGHDRPVAMVVPHAGYIYSGQIAADGYRQAMEHDYDLVVILGANHATAGFRGVSVHTGAGYRTPLGLAAIDRDVAKALMEADPAFTFRSAVHEQEHSVEVQVPFVQVAFPGLKIVTAVIGRPEPGLCGRFGRALAAALENRRALIVASSDLSHYPSYEDGVAADHATLTAMARLDPATLRKTTAEELGRGRENLSTCACGEAPALAAMEAARLLGATRGRVVSYANSGDTAVGDRSRVVGYGAVVFTAGTPGSDVSALRRPTSEDDAPMTPADHRELLAFARASIERFVTTGTAPLARDISPTLWRKQGAFVTLKKKGDLRGCIGHTKIDRPLCQLVGAMALQAAFNDRRFPPLEQDELPEVEIEISLLSPLTPVASPQEIEIGRDGVVIEKDGRSALFLPQVAVEQRWTCAEMLRHLCRKAGLPEDGWRSGAEFKTFRAVVIRESGGS